MDIGDIDEALRLMECSKSTLLNREATVSRDPISIVFDIIREMSTLGNSGKLVKELRYVWSSHTCFCLKYPYFYSLSEVRERVISKGLSEDNLQRCIDTYAEDDVWMLVANGSKLRWMGVEDDDESDTDL